MMKEPGDFAQDTIERRAPIQCPRCKGPLTVTFHRKSARVNGLYCSSCDWSGTAILCRRPRKRKDGP